MPALCRTSVHQTELHLPHLHPVGSEEPVLPLQAAYPHNSESDSWTDRNTDPHILSADGLQSFPDSVPVLFHSYAVSMHSGRQSIVLSDIPYPAVCK